MSGYLEVKYPFKSNLGLNPFKSWKKQWCILRPSVTCKGGGSLVVYCSEAGSPAGTVELPSGCLVKRAKSRTRPHAFAVFTLEAPSKPRILLAAQSHQETQIWMDKIRDLLNNDKMRGSESLLKDSYPVTVIATELSRKCGLMTDSVLTLSTSGLVISHNTATTKVDWQHIIDVLLIRKNGDKNRNCIISMNSDFSQGSGEMRFCTPLASELVSAVRQGLSARHKKLSRSDGDLRRDDIGEIRRSSWYSGPSEISLDDTDLIMTKEYQQMHNSDVSQLSEIPCEDKQTPLSPDNSVWSRRSTVSIVSVASGVYEEIPEEWAGSCVDHTYESVECVYGTMRRAGRRGAPPLPPRHNFGTMKLSDWKSANSSSPGRDGVTRHSSLGSLQHCAKPHRYKHTFSVFRKRLKSDSRVTSPKSEKETKDVETKKKRFDFTPTRDIFKSFKVNRKMKNLKITGNLSKGETKSCEFLDETEHVSTNRCSKSVECIEKFDDFDVSIEINETNVSALALPEEIVKLIFTEKILGNFENESEYMPMSPVQPPPMEQHYIVMSPKTKIA
ncbi:uncharacterized protein LOC110998821 [Pieris rapae]|uniref:uncharacterized protein LOC110998821 n=1 Tax=Pieris rapae TaxID=64459 RepID=UPI001E27BBA1|nr:uncharacterized protein LOC110998821 [Pieris rapae]